MNTRRLLMPALLLLGSALPMPSAAQLPASSLNTRRKTSKLADEPGTITVEGLLPKPVAVKIPAATVSKERVHNLA